MCIIIQTVLMRFIYIYQYLIYKRNVFWFSWYSYDAMLHFFNFCCSYCTKYIRWISKVKARFLNRCTPLSRTGNTCKEKLWSRKFKGEKIWDKRNAIKLTKLCIEILFKSVLSIVVSKTKLYVRECTSRNCHIF